MDGRRARLIDPVLDNLPRLAKATAKPATKSEGRLATGWAALLGVGWPVALWIGSALEPPAAHPEAVPPPLVELGSSALSITLLITIAAALGRHPIAAWAAVVTGLITLGFSLTCPLSGHHMYGPWWIAQLSVTAAMLTASALAVGHRSRTSP